MIVALKNFKVGRFTGFVVANLRFLSPSLEEYAKSAFGVFEENLYKQVSDPDATRVHIFGKNEDHGGNELHTALKASAKSFPLRYQSMVELYVMARNSLVGNGGTLFMNIPSWIRCFTEDQQGEHYEYQSIGDSTLNSLWSELALKGDERFLKISFFSQPARWSVRNSDDVGFVRLADCIQQKDSSLLAAHFSLEMEVVGQAERR